MQHPLLILAENSFNDERFQDHSFVGRLHEDSLWDHEKYWQLEWALHELVRCDEKPRIESVFNIYSYAMILFSCHFDQNDGFSFSNLDDEQICEFRERYQLVFEGFVNGVIPSLESFTQNPLLRIDAG